MKALAKKRVSRCISLFFEQLGVELRTNRYELPRNGTLECGDEMTPDVQLLKRRGIGKTEFQNTHKHPLHGVANVAYVDVLWSVAKCGLSCILDGFSTCRRLKLCMEVEVWRTC